MLPYKHHYYQGTSRLPMFNFLKRNKTNHRPKAGVSATGVPATGNAPVLADLNQEPLAEGDTVESLRYDLGTCRVIYTDKGLTYQSLQDGRQVSWHLMVDAATDLQKVRKYKN